MRRNDVTSIYEERASGRNVILIVGFVRQCFTCALSDFGVKLLSCGQMIMFTQA